MSQPNQTQIVAQPGKKEIVITRVFDAPRELVFKTYTDPKLLPQWWGPRRLTTRVDKMDVAFGGAWRFIQRDSEGNEYAFHGRYLEIVPSERLVQTFNYEALPGHEMTETVRFEAVDGKTEVTDTAVFRTVEDRDGMVHSGMADGVRESMDRFAELLGRIQSKPPS